ncbi:MAG: aminotransferase class V-fold PLP-dependent enzyme [Saprospiraceae bacterium]|nr:aminotransferase class V-fold PLP-dependent enzyme [Saprospiraceae bacterium]
MSDIHKEHNDIDGDLQAFQSLAQALLKAEAEEPVIEPMTASQILDRIDLSLGKDSTDDEHLLSQLKKIILSTPRTSTNMFFNQLFGGRQSKAVLGELLAVLLNTSMYTFKVGGPQIVIEQEILDNMARLAGYDQQSGGTIAPGGSMSNLMAMIMGRDQKSPNIRKQGVRKPMTLYTSEQSHYSIPKNASFIGVGRDQIRFIKTNNKGEMDPDDLERRILLDLNEGYEPFLVNATAGTTVMGAFDPINEIADIAYKYELWLHVDGAYCGSVLFSKQHKHLLDGVSRADSFSVNAHKMLGVPLTCSLLLVKEKAHLYESFSNTADYLYQTGNDHLNPGKVSLQCGRRNDALKFWTLWKSLGTEGLGKAVDHQFRLAQVARDYVREHPDYELYNYDDTIAICFNYKGISAEEICTRLYEEGEIMVGFGRFREDTFIRLITVNYALGEEELMNFFKRLEVFVDEHILTHSEV